MHDERQRTSVKKREANRRNAQLSTGPKTERGKAWSRRNAVKHGLLASTLLITKEEEEEVAAEFVRVMQGRRNCASSTSRSCRSRRTAEAAHRHRRASKPTELRYLSPTKASGSLPLCDLEGQSRQILRGTA